LPLQDPQRAADELARAVRVLGLRGAQIGTPVNGSNLDDPALEPVWAAANDLRAFILVHPHGEILPGDRLKSYYMRNFVGLPFETTMAGAALVFGGVIERYPAVSFCLCHGGGFLPYQAGRFLHAFDVRAEPRRRLRGSPQDSLARLHYDTIVHSPRALEFLVATAGPQRVLMGSDYPFDMGEFDCVARVDALAISQTDRDAVRGIRANELLTSVLRPQP
jgi:aminocarboxymuconate-semialdehyde decarboxylase